MKKWILVVLMALSLSGCSVTSLLLYATDLQEKITEFENSSNQFIYNTSSFVEMSDSKGSRSVATDSLSFEYQKMPYYLHYNNYIETELDGERKYYSVWPINVDNMNMYREVEPGEVDLVDRSIKTKKLIIFKHNESSYTLEGKLEHFLSKSEVTEIYDAIHKYMPDKDLENNINAKMTIDFSEYMMNYTLSFEVTERFIPSDYVINIDVNIRNEVHIKAFEVFDVTSDDRFFPAPDSESLVEVDASKPIYYSTSSKENQSRYKMYLEPGNYVVNSNTNFIFDIRSLDDTVSYRLFPNGNNLTEPLNRMFSIKEAGYYCFISNLNKINIADKAQLHPLDTSLFDLTSPEITVTGTGEYNYRFTEPNDVITIKFEVPLGSTIHIRSDYNPTLTYQKAGDDLFSWIMLGNTTVSLTKTDVYQLTYLTYHYGIISFGKLYITVNTPA